MTFEPDTPANEIANKPLVIATDLDGTFLGGSENARASFYRWIEKNRANVGLIFVTGREPQFIRKLTMDEGVPKPDYAICDPVISGSLRMEKTINAFPRK